MSRLPRFVSETGIVREDLVTTDSPEAICGTQQVVIARKRAGEPAGSETLKRVSVQITKESSTSPTPPK